MFSKNDLYVVHSASPDKTTLMVAVLYLTVSTMSFGVSVPTL